MNLIDQYVAEVGKHLPRKNRVDIEAEIRSTLEDMLEERSGSTGPADEATIIQLLKEYGEPRKVAESYGAKQYLIGPKLFPVFMLVTQIVVVVLFIISLVSVGLGLGFSESSGPEFLANLGKSLLDILGGLITVFGNIVLVFAILERVLPEKEFEEDEEWNPAELAHEPDPDQVKFGEQIVTIFFTAAFLIVLNLYPDIIGFGFMTDGKWTFISPILSDAFFSYLPWINLIGVLEILLSIVLIRQKLLQPETRIAKAVLEAGNLALAVVMLRGPRLVDLSVSDFAGTPLAEDAGLFVGMSWLIPMVVLAVVIIVSSIEVGQTIYYLVKNRSRVPYPMVK